MARYGDLRELPAFAELERPRPAIMKKLRSRPGVPRDYLAFVEEVGVGTIGVSAYKLYEGLGSPAFIYDPESAASVEHVALFGDDFGGYCAGFDTTKKWAVVEIDPDTMQLRVVARSFEQFIRRKAEQIGGTDTPQPERPAPAGRRRRKPPR